MKASLIILILIVVAAVLSALLFRRRKSGDATTPIALEQASLKSVVPLDASTKPGLDLALFDENGIRLLESREIERIPARAYPVESSSSAISRVTHLAADLFKGGRQCPEQDGGGDIQA